jgi:hypothetical protein
VTGNENVGFKIDILAKKKSTHRHLAAGIIPKNFVRMQQNETKQFRY